MTADEFELVEFDEMTAGRRAQLERDEIDPFDSARSTLQWRPKDRHVALRGPDGRLAASVGMVDVEVDPPDGERLRVLGIGGVIVAAPYRGQGLARALLTEVFGQGERAGADGFLLFCHRDRAGLYERVGFTEIAPPMIVRQPGGEAEMPLVSMWRGVREDASPPPGRLRLLSLPF
ncbi:MAG TPA: GNAT family N-acetyltransferase [Solirubrobacteraceae bacterium]|jgi:predicted N-acetyltransferase YhbS